jgi:hypothetical protein
MLPVARSVRLLGGDRQGAEWLLNRDQRRCCVRLAGRIVQRNLSHITIGRLYRQDLICLATRRRDCSF